MPLPEKGYKRVLVIFAYSTILLAVVFLFFKYLFSPLLAFFCAFLIASISRPLINNISKKLSIPKKLCSILFNIISICILTLLLYLALSRLLGELTLLIEFLSSNKLKELFEALKSGFGGLISKFPQNNLTQALLNKGQLEENLITSTLKEFIPLFIKFLIGFFSFFPTAAVFLLLMFISMFYIGCDYERISEFLSCQLSDKAKNTAFEIKRVFLSICTELFKAYFLLTIITFFELFIGFTILRVRYSVILAIVISIVDMLPILGTGTVLVPWSIFSLLLGNSRLCVGLLILYGIITLIRQILEPRIVGASIGLYPLVTLICMYCGLKLIGFPGLFLFPIIAMVIKSLNDKGIVHLYKNIPITPAEQREQSKQKFVSFKKNDRRN